MLNPFAPMGQQYTNLPGEDGTACIALLVYDKRRLMAGKVNPKGMRCGGPRRLQVAMSKQLLNRAHIGFGFQ